ncbi:hypothetical protein BDN72DRAFT_881628, partial [Pluteus cervinus]
MQLTQPAAKGLDPNRTNATVNYFGSSDKVSRRVAFPENLLSPKPVDNDHGKFAYQKVFGDGDFIAAGVLVLPPQGIKPSNNAKANTLMFYLAAGTVKFSIENDEFVLHAGGMFMVPRGNVYNIHNVGQIEAKIFFTQARRMILESTATNTTSGVPSTIAAS